MLKDTYKKIEVKMFNLLCSHSHYSILRGLNTPKQIVERAEELGYTSIALTDDTSISGAVPFFKAAKAANIKPLLGSKFKDFVLIAKNKNGWKKLIKVVSGLEEPLGQNLICIVGRIGCHTTDLMFTNPTIAYNLKDADAIKEYIDIDADEHIATNIEGYIKRFGKENVFLEVQLHDIEETPAQLYASNMMKKLAEIFDLKCVATTNPHYCSPGTDVDDHRLLLALSAGKKLSEMENIGFFASKNYYLHSQDEIENMGFTHEEINNTQIVADMCEEYDILNRPMLPKFKCPNNQSDNEYLRQLCRNGWKEKGIDNTNIEYADRVKKELNIIEGANLASYFLIVQDYVIDAKKHGLVGTARGSVGGSLVAYLIEITDVDPIKYGLIFERFYNAGRNTEDRVALPDIDIDFEVDKREKTITYIRDKYGHDHVAQMVTFGRLMGRGALKEVLRAHNTCGFAEMNKITSFLPQESSISDELEVMRQDGKKSSIIQWALEHRGNDLKEWCYLDENGKYQGEYSKRFEQAYRLEGVYKSSSKHPAGVIVSSEPITDICPMIKDKSSDEMITSFEMNECEDVGLVKFDCLGLNTLDKLKNAQELINET